MVVFIGEHQWYGPTVPLFGAAVEYTRGAQPLAVCHTPDPGQGDAELRRAADACVLSRPELGSQGN